MYNRYIPQSDGTHKRRSVREPEHHAAPKPMPCPQEQPCPAPPPEPPQPPRPCPRAAQPRQDNSAGTFLRNLIPANLDTGDLMILLLLLLMAGDCPEDRNWAWLTLALYLFL